MKSFLISLISIYLLLLGYVYLAQRTFIYFPGYTKPARVATNLELKNEGLVLKGWQLNTEEKHAILYFGGNGESVEYNLPEFQRMFNDHAVYLLAYRGYGDSEGAPSEQGLYADALALYDKVAADHSKISVIGRSLGSAVATYVAHQRKVEQVVLVTPFASLVAMGRRQFPFFPVSLLLKDRYESDLWAGKIDVPTMIIYGTADNIVPVSTTRDLISAFKVTEPLVVPIAGAGHNNISAFPDYDKKLEDFFTKAN